MIPIKPQEAIWSDEQWRAIYETGKNILVNAGAGSGKTAVLTERIVRILKEGIGFERLIVLTFTRAAASEMKERLRSKLTREIQQGCSALQTALDYLDQAAVQTFDSFALELVRRYHYLLGVDRSLRIGDAVIFAITRKEIIDAVFNEFYEAEDAGFQNLVSLFSIKNDHNLQKYLYNISKKIALLPDPAAYLQEYPKNFYSEEFIRTRIREFETLLTLERERIRERLAWLKGRVTDEALMLHVLECEEALTSVLSARHYRDYLEAEGLRLPTIPRAVDDERQKALVSYQKQEIKKSLTKIQDYLEYRDEEEMLAMILETRVYAESIIALLERSEAKLQAFKRENNIYEFEDIARMAIRLVRENDEVRENLREQIAEILIDEYQDTNDLQEILINYLARNNVYMVGDIKQSIYRFRNANPDIFRSKYREFSESGTGLVIDLSKNFRSRKEVLEDINRLFARIMSEDLGGADYTESHALRYGNKTYDAQAPNENYHLEILNYDYQNQELTEHELDAFVVAEDIQRKIKAGYQIYDKDLRLVRPARYSDFTILTTEKKQFDLYKKIFESKQIPLVIHKDESFVKSSEIYVLKNILRIIWAFSDSDFQGDLRDAVIGVLRSFLVSGSDPEISKLFLGDLRQGLKSLFPEVEAKLTNISGQVQKSTLSQILWQIYREFAVYEKIVLIGEVEQVEEKLNFLLTKFQEFDELGYRLPDAIAYLEGIMAEDLDIEFSAPAFTSADAVNMMSIHKSKGLEFAVCYYPELGCRFNLTDIRDKIVFDSDYGIILPVFREGLKDTFYKTLLKQKYLQEEISERIRVLYVALTRAKEQIIIVSPEFGESYQDEAGLIPYGERLNYNSFFSIFSSVAPSFVLNQQKVLTYGLNRDYQKSKALEQLNITGVPQISRHLLRLEKKREERAVASGQTQKLLDRQTLENLEFGTRLHRYLEILDFREDIASLIDALPETEVIKTKLRRFFAQDLFKKQIIRTYHEYQFRYEKEASISGSIDLLLETADELIIVDYKTADLSKPEYRRQLAIYKEYLESISSKPVSCYLYSLLGEKMEFIC
jgi:ATP-dependent helicase/nuclease subunit A